jgi:hypothetical protein
VTAREREHNIHSGGRDRLRGEPSTRERHAHQAGI